MQAASSLGGHILIYTPRFTLRSMRGSTPPEILLLQSSSRSSPPPSRVDNLLKTPPTPDEAKASAAVPYSKQAGWPTKYAPMQKQPGTTVKSAGKAERLFPTSSYSVFKRKQAPTPNAQTTVTVPWDYRDEVTSVVNMATPAPRPEEAGGQKRLRWME